MKLENIYSIQEIYQRIEEIQSLEKRLETQFSEEAFFKNVEKPNFSQELKKQITENPAPQEVKTETIPPTPEQTKSSQTTKPLAKKKPSLLSFIEKEAKARNIDPDLVKAIIKAESNFNPKAESPKGAMGLMQIMPSTAEALGITNPFNPFENIKGGITYLQELSRIFKKKEHVIAAYNAGPGAVKKYKGIPPYQETQNYVQKVTEFLEDYKEE